MICKFWCLLSAVSVTIRREMEDDHDGGGSSGRHCSTVQPVNIPGFEVKLFELQLLLGRQRNIQYLSGAALRSGGKNERQRRGWLGERNPNLGFRIVSRQFNDGESVAVGLSHNNQLGMRFAIRSRRAGPAIEAIRSYERPFRLGAPS